MAYSTLRAVRSFLPILLTASILLGGAGFARSQSPFPGTKPLTMEGDLSAQMVAGIDKFLMREIKKSVSLRKQYWNRDASSPEAWEKSLEPNRARLRKILGVVDERLPVTALEYVGDTATPAMVAESSTFTVYAVKWQVLKGVYGEGLLLQPKGAIKAYVVAIPDADQTPEMLVGLAPGIKPENQFARRLAEQGCLVVVPTLINRDSTWSGNEELGIMTNQPHREWIYRQAFEMGRHVIGYEIQKVLGVIDWFSSMTEGSAVKIGVVGYAEGGMLALYSGALDNRIDATLVSGYFGPRERVWEEPIYRNVQGLLKEFGDAELSVMIAPRAMLVEHSETPKIDGPPAAGKGRRGGAAPGKISTPKTHEVETEFLRGTELLPKSMKGNHELAYGNEGTNIGPGSRSTLRTFLKHLGNEVQKLKPSSEIGGDSRKNSDPNRRQKRQIQELVDFTQNLLRFSEYVRHDQFWAKLKPTTPEQWEKDIEQYKDDFWDNVIGRLPPANLPANPRMRLIKETDKWTCYEVVLDVYQDVYAWGYLLLPKDMKPGEKRPVVVCQHGLEGLPADVIEEDETARPWRAYKAFAAKLAERGFITFAPHNPYRGHDDFRVLQRKLNPLGKTLFSVILPQHDRILDWLSEQPFVDPERIGFYGLSYGGKTAMRVPSLLDRYALSICSADFNEWVRKNMTVDRKHSYMFTGEYEIFEFDMGHTYNYAEMGGLIAPRPFMVERGHNDGVAPDEWVAYEYAKIRRIFGYLGIPERTEIEYFNGPHTINEQGTYRFLHKHLNWPEPKDK
jgi:dienelactone hydrolase